MTKTNETGAGKGGAAKAAPLYPSGKYKCPKCSNRIKVFVNMSMPPACTKHTSGYVAMNKED